MKGKIAWLVWIDPDSTADIVFTKPDIYDYFLIQPIVYFEVEDKYRGEYV